MDLDAQRFLPLFSLEALLVRASNKEAGQ